MATVQATPNTTISADRSTQYQLWSHGATRGRGTIRSSASDSDAATAATATLLMPLLCCWLATHSIHEVVPYPRGTSCTDGGLDRAGTEASDAPTTRWRGSDDDCEASKSGFRSTTILPLREARTWIFQLVLVFETAI